MNHANSGAAQSPISRDYEAYMDLIKRANSLRSMGYIASADAMLQRAWRVAARFEAAAIRPFVGSNARPTPANGRPS